jgi:hypothetical protein
MPWSVSLTNIFEILGRGAIIKALNINHHKPTQP